MWLIVRQLPMKAEWWDAPLALGILAEAICTTIRPKIRVLIDLFLSFAQVHSAKIYDRLSFILSLSTTIRPQIRVLINYFYLHTTIWPKLGVTLSPKFILFLIVPVFCLLYSWQYFPYTLYALFLEVLLLCFVRYGLFRPPLYFVHCVHGTAALIFRTLYSWIYEVFTEIGLARFNHGSMRSLPK